MMRRKDSPPNRQVFNRRQGEVLVDTEVNVLVDTEVNVRVDTGVNFLLDTEVKCPCGYRG